MQHIQDQGTRQDPDICFNEQYNLNLKFNNIKENYERYEDGMKAYVFDILPKEKNPCAYPVT